MIRRSLLSLALLLPCLAAPVAAQTRTFDEVAARTVNTTAAMAALSPAPTNGSTVITRGATSVGDGGGATYIYRATGRSGVSDDTLGFYVTGPGADDYFEAVDKSRANLVQFGAVNYATNASFDCTAALVRALKTGVPVEIPTGTWRFATADILNSQFTTGELASLKRMTVVGAAPEMQVQGTPESSLPKRTVLRIDYNDIDQWWWKRLGDDDDAAFGSTELRNFAIELVSASAGAIYIGENGTNPGDQSASRGTLIENVTVASTAYDAHAWLTNAGGNGYRIDQSRITIGIKLEHCYDCRLTNINLRNLWRGVDAKSMDTAVFDNVRSIFCGQGIVAYGFGTISEMRNCYAEACFMGGIYTEGFRVTGSSTESGYLAFWPESTARWDLDDSGITWAVAADSGRLELSNIPGSYTAVDYLWPHSTIELTPAAVIETALSVDTRHQWTASGSGTDEYYLEVAGGGDPDVSEPVSMTGNNLAFARGTAGSLAASEWDYGDNDSLGYDTVYVRLADGADPDSKSNIWVEAFYNDQPYKLVIEEVDATGADIKFSGLDGSAGRPCNNNVAWSGDDTQAVRCAGVEITAVGDRSGVIGARCGRNIDMGDTPLVMLLPGKRGLVYSDHMGDGTLDTAGVQIASVNNGGSGWLRGHVIWSGGNERIEHPLVRVTGTEPAWLRNASTSPCRRNAIAPDGNTYKYLAGPMYGGLSGLYDESADYAVRRASETDETYHAGELAPYVWRLRDLQTSAWCNPKFPTYAGEEIVVRLWSPGPLTNGFRWTDGTTYTANLTGGWQTIGAGGEITLAGGATAFQIAKFIADSVTYNEVEIAWIGVKW